jgi:uncharacterized protein involved in tolerance to divalent cations
MNNYFQAQISAETKDQADQILNALLKEKLVTGGQIINAPARFLWKGEVADIDYFMINSFTIRENKEKIIKVVEGISVEEVPMISFTAIEGNEKLLNWIIETLN